MKFILFVLFMLLVVLPVTSPIIAILVVLVLKVVIYTIPILFIGLCVVYYVNKRRGEYNAKNN